MQDLRNKSNEEVVNIVQQTSNICVKTSPKQLNNVNRYAVIKYLRQAGFIALATFLTNYDTPVFAQTPVDKTSTATDYSNDDIMGDLLPSPLQAISSPMELVEILDSLDSKRIHYKSAYLKPILPSYPTVLSKESSLWLAWRYGAYASSVGYTYFYNDSYKAFQYHKAMQEIAQLLNFKVKKELQNTTQKILYLKSNQQKMIELLNNTQRTYENLCEENLKASQDGLFMLVLLSGWLEAVYLTTLHYEEQPLQKLRDEILIQKTTLDILTLYTSSSSCLKNTTLQKDFETLNKLWQAVKLKTLKKPPTIIDNGKGEVLVQINDVTEVNIEQEDLEKLLAAIKNLRNKYQ
ncbi:MAG: hypothetical protein ACOVQA_12370 [Thermoflexibacteraceae bacterium]